MVTYEDLQSACRDVHLYERYFIAICPFHQDSSPSMQVFVDGWFHCLGCQKNGRWVTLWNKIKGQPVQVMPERKTQWATPRVRVEDLEEICYQAHMDLIGFPSLGWYMEMRGIADRVETNEIGYWDGWYTIPVRSREGDFLTAVFRSAPHVQEATGLRYWCPHPPVMYVPDWMMYLKSDHLIVVYGMLDALAVSSLRHPVVTGTGGQLTFDSIWLEDYRKPIWIIPDEGEEKAARELAKGLGWRAKVLRVDYPDGVKDPAGFIQAGKGDELDRILGGL